MKKGHCVLLIIVPCLFAFMQIDGPYYQQPSLLPLPHWKNAAMKGDPEIPLTDEGYSYRPPLKVHFRKGWSYILVKAPVGSFRGKDWQNPAKWMFTAVPVQKGKGMNWDTDTVMPSFPH